MSVQPMDLYIAAALLPIAIGVASFLLGAFVRWWFE